MTRYTEQDAREWARLYTDEGWTFEQLHLELGVAQDTLRRWFAKLDVQSRAPGSKPSGEQSNSVRRRYKSQAHLEPRARVVRPSAQRLYR